MKYEAIVFKPGSAKGEPVEVELPEEPGYRDLKAVIEPLVQGGSLEHVSVLFEGRRADMFVDEYGAIRKGSRPPLPINDAATAIYHAASKARGQSAVGAPMIHGPAVLFKRIVWR